MSTFFKTLALASILFASTTQAATVINGSFEDGADFVNGADSVPGSQQVTAAGLPNNWTNGIITATSNSPDTINLGNYLGRPNGNQFRATPTASNDGGSWVGVAREDAFSLNENFSQTINDFTIGQNYQIKWEDANFGILFARNGNPVYDDTNSFTAQLLSGGNTVFSYTGQARAIGSDWLSQTSSIFTAQNTSYTLQFQIADGSKSSYMSIDGIQIVEAQVAAVPEPQTWALMLGGLMLIGFTARKRALNS